MQTKWTLLVFIYPHQSIDREFYSILVVRSFYKVANNLQLPLTQTATNDLLSLWRLGVLEAEALQQGKGGLND